MRISIKPYELGKQLIKIYKNKLVWSKHVDDICMMLMFFFVRHGKTRNGEKLLYGVFPGRYT
jgi:hypothetical protein